MILTPQLKGSLHTGNVLIQNAALYNHGNIFEFNAI